jgi:hypothetical protein
MLRRAGVGALEHPAPVEVSMTLFLILNLLFHVTPWLVAIVLCALIIADCKKHE